MELQGSNWGHRLVLPQTLQAQSAGQTIPILDLRLLTISSLEGPPAVATRYVLQYKYRLYSRLPAILMIESRLLSLIIVVHLAAWMAMGASVWRSVSHTFD
jgi:hypothetical protein